MIRGLTSVPKPCLNKVMVENGSKVGYKQTGFVDLYTEEEKTDINDWINPIIEPPTGLTGKTIQLTFDFSIKIQYPNSLWNNLHTKTAAYYEFQENVQKMLFGGLRLLGKPFYDKNQFKSFLALI